MWIKIKTCFLWQQFEIIETFEMIWPSEVRGQEQHILTFSKRYPFGAFAKVYNNFPDFLGFENWGCQEDYV